MFSKKGTVKTKQVIGGKEQRALRLRLLNLFLGEEPMKRMLEDSDDPSGSSQVGGSDQLAALVERFLPKKGQFVVHKWQNANGSSANIILVNDVATAIELAADIVDESASRGQVLLAPTVFSCLRMRYLLHEFSGAGVGAYLPRMPVVVCTRPTASHLVDSAAHLMRPGVVACISGEGGSSIASRIARHALVLLAAPNTSYPFATGITTEGFERGLDSGRAVTVIHRYDDALWETYAPSFEAYAAVKDQVRVADLVVPTGLRGKHFSPDSSSSQERSASGTVASLPDAICPTIDGSDVNNSQQVEAARLAPEGATIVLQDGTGDLSSPAVNGEEEEIPQARLEALFSSVDEAATFAICEATRRLKKCDLPMPLSTFIGGYVAKFYPRGVSDSISQPIDFKKTSHKKASQFVQSLAQMSSNDAVAPGECCLLTLADRGQGNVELTSFNKSCSVFAQHKKKYRDYLVRVHEPLLECESLDARDVGLASESAGAIARSSAAAQKILAVEDVFRPRGSLPPQLVDILFKASESRKKGEGDDDDEEDEDDLFRPLPWKVIRDNLKCYVVERRLLAAPLPTSPPAEGGVGGQGLPFVMLDHVLMSLWPLNAKEVPDRLTVKELERAFLDRGFCPMHYITTDKSGGSGGTMAGSRSRRRVLHNGVPPAVFVRTEKRCGNKTITIVKNLEALDFDIAAVAQSWKHRFATSVEVLNPRSGMTNVKSGTKVPWEIHLHGSILKDVKAALASEMGVPSALIQ